MRSGHIRPRLNLRDLVATHKKRKAKAVQRRRKYEMRLRATRGEQGLLEMHSIKEPQRRDYLQKLDGFYSFIAQYELPTTTEGQLDAALCEYADLLYLDGYGSRRETDGGHRTRPEFARAGTLHLPRLRRSLKGWRRLAPSQVRMPMIEFLKSAVSGLMQP